MGRNVLREYERLLVHNERFAIADVILSVHAVVETLADAQRVLSAHANTSSSNKSIGAGRHHALAGGKKPTFHDVMDAIARRAKHVRSQAPLFLGESELLALAKALGEFVQMPEVESFWDLEMDASEKSAVDALSEQLQRLKTHHEALSAAITATAAVTSLITAKRNHLVKLLDDAVEIMESSHSQRLLQYQSQVDALVEDYEAALTARSLSDTKQLAFEIRSLETSMSTMLLPHFEICRTITTANAQVEGNAGFNKHERTQIDEFVQSAMKLKGHSASFDSVLNDSSAFVSELKLFERAASQDAFSVCSSALKLQFRESLDEELFQAYVQDWKDKRFKLTVLESSAELRTATGKLVELKARIVKGHAHIQKSKDMATTDDPTRLRLCHEVGLLFKEEGGTMNIKFSLASPSSSAAKSN